MCIYYLSLCPMGLPAKIQGVGKSNRIYLSNFAQQLRIFKGLALLCLTECTDTFDNYVQLSVVPQLLILS